MPTPTPSLLLLLLLLIGLRLMPRRCRRSIALSLTKFSLARALHVFLTLKKREAEKKEGVAQNLFFPLTFQHTPVGRWFEQDS